MTGIQALVRLPMLQWERDSAAGLNTAGYVSGYRGSPLARLDAELWRAKTHLASHHIHFAPGINEDLALTSVWGSQQAEANGTGKYDGVFAMWYAKGPGIDRSGDAFRHANLAGSSQYGGVLALLGDDHTCESSSTAYQSEFSMVDYQVPVLSPSTVTEILEFGLHGWAMSRFSGSWVAIKCLHDIVEASAVVDVALDGFSINPPDFQLPSDGLNLRIPDTPLAQEKRQHEYKVAAALAYCRANAIDKVLSEGRRSKIGIITTGKSHLDLIQALRELDVDLEWLRNEGVGLYKVGMSWPLEPTQALSFCEGLDTVIVIEEKRSLIESQLKELLHDAGRSVRVVGKKDESGETLFPSTGALESRTIANALLKRIDGFSNQREKTEMLAQQEAAVVQFSEPLALTRKPHFCAGCPHNTSTNVPEGSRSIAGTGCSYMAQWMDRRTLGYTHMGADGTTWIGEAPFSKTKHVFQNMGDGTYFHSGLLAIRATLAAKVNITYKILYNDAVAMTGGQAHDGPLSVHAIVNQVRAEGVQHIAVVSDDTGKYEPFPAGVTVSDRSELEQVQKQFRTFEGTTVIVYDQTCAAEKRRRRKRNQFPDPDRRIFINPAVCEGCGDCGVQSNCVAILPAETEFGRKRRIDQSACNKDFSCVNGFCPSFVSVSGATVKRNKAAAGREMTLPDPKRPEIGSAYSILVAGIGGTGVVTLSAVLGMAARLEDKGCALLDMTGLAQKGGAVISYVRLLPDPSVVAVSRIADGDADVIIGADLLVTVNGALTTARNGHTQAVLNTDEVLPGQFTRDRDLQFPTTEARGKVDAAVGKGRAQFFNATQLATEVFGDAIAANLILLGYAYQCGWIPLKAESIEAAIELNGVAVKQNRDAFRFGRQIVVDPKMGEVSRAAKPLEDMSFEEIVTHRSDFLRAYQSDAYAESYRTFVESVRRAESRLSSANGDFSRAVAIGLAKVMAYKDEYEVARLYSTKAFKEGLEQEFDGQMKLKFHLAPPILSKTDSATGRPRKLEFGPWILPAFSILARLKWLRGTAIDPFGRTEERRSERALIESYKALVNRTMAVLTKQNYPVACRIASAVFEVRGFGPVKHQAMEAYEEKIAELEREFATAR